MNIVDQIASMQIELDNLRSKDEQSDRMIAVLKEQNELMSMEISQMTSDHAGETRRMRQRTNRAVSRETEINGILNTVAAGIVSGLAKMKGDETPREIPDRPTKVSDHHRLPPNVMPVSDDPYAPPQHRGEVPPLRMSDLDDGVRSLVRSLPRREAP